MKGARALSEKEIERTLLSFSGTYATRDKALFTLGVKSGLRISEILSITYGHIYRNGEFQSRIYIDRKSMKGKVSGRSVIVNQHAKEAIQAWITELKSSCKLSQETFLFQSRKGLNKAISVQQAWNILKKAFNTAGISGKVSCHSMRKGYAQQIYLKLNKELHLVQIALGHRNINSTIQYLHLDHERVEEAILSL